MKELPPDEGSDSGFPDFGDFEKIIGGFDSGRGEPPDAPQDPTAPAEADVPEPPAESRLLEAQELSEARDLIEAVERTISSAELNFKGYDGSYYLHVGEEVTTDSGGTVNLVRDSFGSDTYTLVDIDKKAASAVLVKNGELHIKNPEDLKKFEDTEAAIARGEIKGSHTYTAVKALAPDPGYGPEAHLFADITRRSDGEGSTETQLELTLMRFSNDTGDTVRQTVTLESDPNTGNIQAKSSLESHSFVNMSDENPTNPATTFMPVADPMPEMTAKSLQERFSPELRLDRDLSLSEWQNLIKEPLQPEHLIDVN